MQRGLVQILMPEYLYVLLNFCQISAGSWGSRLVAACETYRLLRLKRRIKTRHTAAEAHRRLQHELLLCCKWDDEIRSRRWSVSDGLLQKQRWQDFKFCSRKYFIFCSDDQEINKQKFDVYYRVNPAADDAAEESWAGSSGAFVIWRIKQKRFINSFSLGTDKCWFPAVGDFAGSRSEPSETQTETRLRPSACITICSSLCVCVCVCVWPHSSRGCWEIWDVNAEPFVSSSFLWEMFFLPSFCHPRHLVSTSGLNGTAGSYFKVGSRSDTQPRPPQTRRSTTTQLRGGGM